MSERLPELFVLSAAFYVDSLRPPGQRGQEAVLHDVSRMLSEPTPSPGQRDGARLTLLRDGLCDAADLAMCADPAQIAGTLNARAGTVSGLVHEKIGSAWDEVEGVMEDDVLNNVGVAAFRRVSPHSAA